MVRRIGIFGAVHCLSAVVCLFLPGSAQAQSAGFIPTEADQAELNSLASRTAQRIREAHLKEKTPAVLVIDLFRNSMGNYSMLGTLLADKLSESLAARAKGFKVLGRKTFSEYLVQNWMTLEDLQSTDVFFQIGRQTGASGVILGTMQEENGKLYLTLHLVGFCPPANPKDIFEATDDRIRFPLTDELHALFLEPGPNYTRKPDQIPEEPGIFKANISGVSSPKCLYCPQRGYSDVARAANYQGSVTLSIVVTAAGEVTSIYVMKAAPFGLTTEAIKDAKQWRMEPGKKDGNPVSVRVQIECTFHLY
jgi:TonB family protein